MNRTIPVRITLKFDVADAAADSKARFDEISSEFAARSFIRGTAYRIIEQYPIVLQANVTKKHAAELRKKEYVKDVTQIMPQAQPLKARESFYRARIADYVSP